MGVKEKALQVIRREQMLPPDCAVVAGVSGGADSVALLHLLVYLRSEGRISDLTVVHINHSLRGEESLRDQSFVEELCREWNVPITVEKHDVAEVAARQGKGVEEIGRELRYSAFQNAARGYPYCRIATAHTADDNAETLLLHLCRGSGLHGAAGIPPVRGNIIRPLITCTREDIEAYCAEHHLPYVTDSSNADTAYARNRIRHAVMPQLRAINPQTTTAITRFIEQARQVDDFIEKLAEKALVEAKAHDFDAYSRDVLLSLEEPIRSCALCRIVKTAEERHIALLLSALEAGSGAVVLPSGARFCVTDTLFFEQPPADEDYPSFSFPVIVGTRYTVGDNTYCFSLLSRAEYEQKLNIFPHLFQNAFDYDRINGDLFVRQRQDGDRFRPAGRNCGKSLKKLFNEQKTALRDQIPIVCDAQGIVLVCGFGCDERVSVTADTQTILLLEKEEDVYESDAP